MRPALSVIFFTVSSGVGLGLLVWLVAMPLCGFAGYQNAASVLPMLGLGMALTAAGLLSSTLHLANPKNAWRAFSQVRTSWLSREGVLAVALFPLAILYALLWIFPLLPTLRTVVGVILAALALGVLYCTGMIYACLKTVPRWHTPLVPAGYLLLGLYSGALVGLAFNVERGGAASSQGVIALALLVAALIVKSLYYLKFRAPVTVHSINDALTLGPKSIRLLDVGHTHGTFLTDEFCFKLARGHALALRVIAIVAGFVIPFVAITLGTRSVLPLSVAALVCALGLLAERWLFFAEAEHVVRLYHGSSRV